MNKQGKRIIKPRSCCRVLFFLVDFHVFWRWFVDLFEKLYGFDRLKSSSSGLGENTRGLLQGKYAIVIIITNASEDAIW